MYAALLALTAATALQPPARRHTPPKLRAGFGAPTPKPTPKKEYSQKTLEKAHARFDELKRRLQLPVQLLQQDDEAERAAQCAHGIMQTRSLALRGLTLYVEAGRGSTQFSVLDPDGKIVHRAYADGFPKKGAVPYVNNPQLN